MAKLSFLGIGPRIGAVALPWLALAIAASYRRPDLFTVVLPSAVSVPVGVLLLAAFLAFYGATVRTLLRGLRNTELLTTGPFRLCRNPLYASFLLLLVPALAVLLKSWLVLTTSLAGYALFKSAIGREYAEMRGVFGERWDAYARETPELLPVRFR